MAELQQMFVYFNGTKDAFISAGHPATYTNYIVFIKGDASGNGSCIYTHGSYFANFAELIAAINYVKGIKVGEDVYNAAAGGGYLAFEAADPTTVNVNLGQNGIQIGLTEAFVKKVNDTATLATTTSKNLGTKDDAADKDGSAFARIANLAALVSDLTGGSTDSIEGQINNAIEALRTDIVGGLGEGDSATLAAINDELDALQSSLTTLETRITTEAPVTITENAGSGEILKTYTFTQNGKTIGQINLAKELVVTGGSIVEINGVKNLQLTIANQTNPVNIPVNELVDAYTAQKDAVQVQITISNTNEISATIVAGSIGNDELANNSITKDKLVSTVGASLDKADSAYQKPVNGIPATDLAQGVQTSLNNADSAMQEADVIAKINASNTWIEL